MRDSVLLADGVHWMGVNDRRTNLFENLWPLPNGVAYNSYLVVDEKVALIDTVEISKADEFMAHLEEVLNGRPVDYIVINHIEPDHSGAIKDVIRKYPDVQIVGNKMTFSLLRGFYGVIDNTLLVKNNDELDLGTRKLKFLITPWVHWPETMMSYLVEDQILFSGDAFGSFGTLDGGVFNDQVNMDRFRPEMLRYYSNIVGKYSKMVTKAITAVKGLPGVSTIASTHGPVWRTQIDYIVGLYEKWSSYQAEKGVVIIFGSMYGNTEKMADTIARRLSVNGIKDIIIHDASKTHISDILRDAWQYKGILLGSSAYNSGLFPAMETLVNKFLNIGLQNRVLGLFGSSGWNKAGVKVLKSFADESKWDFIPEIIIEAKGSPTEVDLEMCNKLADAMCEKLG